MRILLVRHAEAVSGGDGLDDAGRYLSPHGRTTAQRVASTLSTLALHPTRFVASPRVRTQQTAEIFASTLGFPGAVEDMPSLCYTKPAKEAAAELRAMSGTVFAFGHMPTVVEIGQLLCGGRALSSFAPSEVLLIENGRALWSMDPDRLTLTRF
jgi:phosphohistidine phosphatase SixA